MCLTLDLDLWPFTLTFDLDLDLWALFYMWKQVKLRFFRQKCGFLDKTWIFSQNALWLPPMICLFQYFKICKISTCKITLKGQGQRSRSKVKVKVKVKVKGQGQRSRSRVTILKKNLLIFCHNAWVDLLGDFQQFGLKVSKTEDF